MDSPNTAVACLALASFTAPTFGCAVRTAEVRTAAPAPAGASVSTVVSPAFEARILASARDCSGNVDRALRPVVEHETPEIVDAFRRLGITVANAKMDTSKSELLATVGAASGPLVVIYSGHGRWADRKTGRVLDDQEHLKVTARWAVRSVLCLKDGPLAVEDVIASFKSPTPSALLVLNACYSANVDARVAKPEVDVSVLSGSTWMITASSTRTPIGRALIETVAGPLDLDGDGQASDIELFLPLERRFRRVFGDADPKLRRQVRRPPLLFRSTRTEARAVELPSLDAPAETYSFAGRRYVRFPGWVEGSPTAEPAGAAVPGSSMLAVPCLDPLGQCFVLAP